MPTKPRIDFAGFHHIVNRGVNRTNVFNHPNDKDMFLQIINKSSKVHNIILHTYALMDNHYHLLVETKEENLSSFMRIVNANYAIYFNRKYNRSGHLWQDRYKSKYVLSDNYLYTVIKYIEYNPLEANISSKISSYPFTLSYNIFKGLKYYPCCKNSILLKDFDIKTLSDFLNNPLNDKEIELLSEKENIEKKKNKINVLKIKTLNEHFKDVDSKEQRNNSIFNSFYDGYTQVEIGNYLNLSKSSISKILKSGDSTPGVKKLC